MGVALLDLVETALRVAKQALGNRAGKPDSGGLAREAHVVAHVIRKEEGHSYAELVDRLSLMPDVCDRLGISSDAPPDPTTFYHSFDRYAMHVWRALLRISAQQHPQSGRVALDSTFFDRGHASAYYQTRSNQSVETLKVTTLTDTESLAILDIQCHAQWRHDTQTGPQVVRRNADDLLEVLADNGFQNWHTEYEYYALDVEPVIYYRGSSPAAISNNALIQTYDYTQRWMAETSYSSVKRSLGDAVRAQYWYREYREIVLMFAIHNIERLSKSL